jgi:hypothetical protein
MANELVKRQPVQFTFKGELDSGFKWRDQYGSFHRPCDMVTRHLFHTLRMIWNNFMPAHMRVGRVYLYKFKPFYTRRYMAQAVLAIGRELEGRNDLNPQQEHQLWQMAN